MLVRVKNFPLKNPQIYDPLAQKIQIKSAENGRQSQHPLKVDPRSRILQISNRLHDKSLPI